MPPTVREYTPGGYMALFKESLDNHKITEDRLTRVKNDVANTEEETITLREEHLVIAKAKLDELEEQYSTISTPHLLGKSSLPKQRKLMARNLAITINTNAELAARFIENSLLIQQAAVLLTQRIWLYAKKLSEDPTKGKGISLEHFYHEEWEDHLCTATDRNNLQAIPQPPLLRDDIEIQLTSIGFNSDQAINVRRICHTLIQAKMPCQDLITNETFDSEAIAIQAKHMADKLQTDVHVLIGPGKFKETMGDISEILTLTTNRLDNPSANDIFSNDHANAISIARAIVGKINIYLNKVLGLEGTETPKDISGWVDHITTAIIERSAELPVEISNAVEGMQPQLNKNQANHITIFLNAFLQAFQTPDLDDPSTMANSLFFVQLDKAINTRSKRFKDSMAGIAQKLSAFMQPYLIQQRAQQLGANLSISLNRNVAENIDLLLQKIIDDKRITANEIEQLRAFQRTTRWFTEDECERIIAVDYLDPSQYRGQMLPEGMSEVGEKRKKLHDALASYVKDESENNLQAIINNLDHTTIKTHTKSEVSLKEKEQQLTAAQEKFDNAEYCMKDAKKMAHQIKLLLVNAILQYITRSSFGVFSFHGESSLTIACDALHKLITADDPLAIMTAALDLLRSLHTYNQGSLAAYIDNSTTPYIYIFASEESGVGITYDKSKTETDINNSIFYHIAPTNKSMFKRMFTCNPSFHEVKSKVNKKFEHHFPIEEQSTSWHGQIDNLDSSSLAEDGTNGVTLTLRDFKDDIINNVQLTDKLQQPHHSASVRAATRNNYKKQTGVFEVIGNNFNLFTTSKSKNMRTRILGMKRQLSSQIEGLNNPPRT